MSQHSPIPTNIITGFLGVGKTTTILNLLKQKPSHEKWAVLVNEFGEIGLDGALISTESNNDDVFIREVPGGCMCCASGLPMQIALNMLIMKAKPDRLLIEPTGLGHPKEVRQVLQGEHYEGVLSLRRNITLVDSRHFSSLKHIKNDTFQQQLDVADLLVVNKSDLATESDRLAFDNYIASHSHLKNTPHILIEHGKLELEHLEPNSIHPASTQTKCTHQHSHSHSHSHADDSGNIDASEPDLPECGYLVKTHSEGDFTSVGWRINAQKTFVLSGLLTWMKNLDATRIKGLVNCEKGYLPLNLNYADDAHLFDDANVKPLNALSAGENRIEIIFQDQTITEDMIQEWTEHLCQQP